jgi:hypothetical protein
MDPRLFRIAYVIQFVITLMAIFEVWGQVGGQGHIDLMPWYSKLLLAVALALTTVKATSAAVARDKFWNRVTAAWLAAAMILMIAMGALTYYEHLHEPTEEEEDSPSQIVS